MRNAPERLTSSDADIVAIYVIDSLQAMYPHIIKRWDYEMYLAMLADEPIEDWPDYYNLTGAANWLESEISIANTNLSMADSQREQAERDYCISCLSVLKLFMDGGEYEH